jgi:LPS export ABC transporter protein LptC
MKGTRTVKITIAVVIAVILVGGIFFAVFKTDSTKRSPIVKILPNEADVRIQEFVYTEVGKENIRWEVKAKTAQYQKKINLALFNQVQIKWTSQDGRVFVMTGDEGRMQTDTKDVEMKGHVVVTSDAGDRFSTDYLRYSDTQKIIYTDAPVVMENRHMRIQGIGLSILMTKGELLLSSDVRAKIH